MTKPCQTSTTLTDSCGHIDVISCGIDFPHHPDILELIKKADVLFASRSLVAQCSLSLPLPLSSQDTRIIGAHAFEDAQTALALCNEGKHVVVLASGDALYHGFGGTLAKLRTGESICYHPAITAFQALFHRLGMPWNEVRLFSAHAGKLLAVRSIAAAPFSVTYGGTTYPANAVAKALIDFHSALSTRHALIAESLSTKSGSLDTKGESLIVENEILGTKDKDIVIDAEKIVQGSLEELAAQPCGPTSILLIIPDNYQKYLHKIPHISQANKPDTHAISEQAEQNSSQASQTGQTDLASQTNLASQAPLLPLGLPEESYERENNLITASDVRAIILARLRLPAWGVLWDIGAGSGSVGLEAAGLCPHLQVIAIEQHQSRADIIERNCTRMGLINYTVHVGDALDLIGLIDLIDLIDQADRLDLIGQHNNTDKKPLPKPDRIFIGGGGHKLTEILTLCMSKLAPDGLLIASAVTLEAFHILSNWSPERRTALSSIQIAHEQSIAGAHHHLKAQNTIYLFTFRKEIA